MIFNNPELKKNLQLNFSLSKVLVPLLICSITLLACFNTEGSTWRSHLPLNYLIGENIFLWFCTFGFLYSLIIGTFTAVNNFAEEFKQNTWNSIRLTRISPKDLLIGKVLGSTATILISTFFIIIPCLAYSCFLRIYPFKEHLIQDYKVTILMLCLCLTSWVLFSYLFAIAGYLFSRLNTDLQNVGNVVVPLLVFNFFVGILITTKIDKYLSIYKYTKSSSKIEIVINDTYYMLQPDAYLWFGYEFYSFNLITILLTFFTICGYILCLRVVQTHLQIKQKPIYWFIFCLICGLIFSGFNGFGYYEGKEVGSDFNTGIFFLFSLTLATLLLEITNVKKHTQWVYYLNKYDLKNALYLSPIWVRSFSVLLAFCIFNTFISPKLTSTLFSLSLIGLAIRDILAMSFLAKVRSIKFPLFANLLYLILFYSLFPLLLTTIRSRNSIYSKNSYMLPQFPNSDSNITMFLFFLISEVAFWSFLLFIQNLRGNKAETQV
jgi:hypothetical protein